MNYPFIAFLLFVLFFLHLTKRNNFKGSPNQSGGGSCDIIIDSNEEAYPNSNADQCQKVYLSNYVYYLRYKSWWRNVWNLKTRPEYDRIYPPYWNTHYNPNNTSDIYYQKLAADHILVEAKDNAKVQQAHDRNFALRQLF